MDAKDEEQGKAGAVLWVRCEFPKGCIQPMTQKFLTSAPDLNPLGFLIANFDHLSLSWI